MSRSSRHFAPRLFLALVVLVLQGSSPAFAQGNAGTVTEVQGTATIRRGAQGLGVATTMPVLINDDLETQPDSHVTVTLIDGSQLKVSESTRIVVSEYAIAPLRGSINLLIGRLRAIVTFASGGPIPDFEVHTPNAIAGVRGTEFEIAFVEGKPCPGFPTCSRYTEVGVYKGIVEVRNPSNPAAAPVRITPGYETNVPCELAPTSPGPLGMSEMGAPGYR